MSGHEEAAERVLKYLQRLVTESQRARSMGSPELAPSETISNCITGEILTAPDLRLVVDEYARRGRALEECCEMLDGLAFWLNDQLIAARVAGNPIADDMTVGGPQRLVDQVRALLAKLDGEGA